jgi:hypothetical protein
MKSLIPSSLSREEAVAGAAARIQLLFLAAPPLCCGGANSEK